MDRKQFMNSEQESEHCSLKRNNNGRILIHNYESEIIAIITIISTFMATIAIIITIYDHIIMAMVLNYVTEGEQNDHYHHHYHYHHHHCHHHHHHHHIYDNNHGKGAQLCDRWWTRCPPSPSPSSRCTTMREMVNEMKCEPRSEEKCSPTSELECRFL